jgi:hypothetical protein
MAVTIEKIVCTALREADNQQPEETTVSLSNGSEGFNERATFFLPQPPP